VTQTVIRVSNSLENARDIPTQHVAAFAAGAAVVGALAVSLLHWTIREPRERCTA